ncbi:MAG: GNAT family N-acetyltransferase [Parachlamydia sp.]|nr:GNAT family N-acetyltransferase [Parachlamydia sp.]
MLVSRALDEVLPSAYQSFSCGNLDLDAYLLRFARTNHKKGIGKTFVFLNENQVVGYYTVSMACIEFKHLPDQYQKGIPKYPIPVARIGKLAVDTRFQGNGIGKRLLIDGLKRILEASLSVAAYGIIVDAKNHDVKQFYEKLGFVSYKNDPLALYLPITTVQDLFSTL